MFVAIVGMLGLAALGSPYWERLLGQNTSPGAPAYAKWVAAGLVAPTVLWLLLNCGLSSALPPLVPEIAFAKSGGGRWFPLVFTHTVPGLLAIGSYWAAVTFAHFAILTGIQAESRREFAIIAAVLSAILVPLAAFICWKGGLPWAGAALSIWLLPLVHFTVSLVWRPEPLPSYARAIARAKLGKYREAETEVIHQLEQRDDDFEGWMMLADLYANQFGDLAEADRTIRWVCGQPSVTPLQVSIACHRLADWHLKLANDPQAAAAALEELCRRAPGGHFEKMARVRMRQLPRSRQELIEQKNPKPIRLPQLPSDLGEAACQPEPRLSRHEALNRAQEFVDRLKRDPNDAAQREQFAVLLAEELGKADLAIEQLQLLVAMPGQPEDKRAAWLSRIAAWQFRYRRDRPSAMSVLQQLIADFPQTAHAFAAQRWMKLLEMDEPARRETDHRAQAEAPKIKIVVRAPTPSSEDH